MQTESPAPYPDTGYQPWLVAGVSTIHAAHQHTQSRTSPYSPRPIPQAEVHIGRAPNDQIGGPGAAASLPDAIGDLDMRGQVPTTEVQPARHGVACTGEANPESTTGTLREGAPPSQGLTLRARHFTMEELQLVVSLTQRHACRGRTYISEEVCRALGWTQPNGWPKDRACRDVLRQLESLGLLTLPAPKHPPRARQYSKWSDQRSTKISEEKPPTIDLKKVELQLAKGGAAEKLWNQVLHTYHYLGHKVTVGKCLKFLFLSEGHLIGAASLSERAWSLTVRDRLLQHLGISEHLVANNNRLLILPHVRVPNLGTTMMRLLLRQGIQHWSEYYNQDLLCLETFVDPSRFHGTLYKASNWIPIGTTRGYTKSGATHSRTMAPKMIFLYPIQASSRRVLHKYMQVHSFRESGIANG